MIKTFGPNNLTPSKLCFGTMQFGDGASAKDSEEMYLKCRENEVNFFDTAYVYTKGLSEKILGKLIKEEREKLLIVTKAGSQGGADPENLRNQLEESLKRLDQDYVDIFFIHHWDDNTPLEESLNALKELKDEKKFFHLGVSNFAAWQIMKAQYISKINHFPLIEFLQPMYNLVKRQVEVEILPMAHSENLNVISYSPLGGGLLTGKYDQDFRETQKNEIGRLDHNEKYQKRYGQNWMNKVVKDFIKLSKELNYNPISLAVAWVIYNQDILSPIISARNLKQLIPSLDSMKISITKEIYESINKITRTPPPATDRLEDVES